jgi:hypothetical protein
MFSSVGQIIYIRSIYSKRQEIKEKWLLNNRVEEYFPSVFLNGAFNSDLSPLTDILKPWARV